MTQIQQDSATPEKSVNLMTLKDFIGHGPQKRHFFPFNPLKGEKIRKKRPTTEKVPQPNGTENDFAIFFQSCSSAGLSRRTALLFYLAID
jgi:hypothetical protein